MHHNVKTRRILISAGELSGDMYAAALVRKIKTIAPGITFYGMGGELMQKAGVKILVDSRPLSVIGGLDIIIKAVKICRAFFAVIYAIWHDKPDLLLLVDYPGFNLRLAKIAKKAGTKVLYFISPKVWAWHRSRIQIIKECVTLMAVIFPFEVDFYRRAQVPVAFVENPLLEKVQLQFTSRMARNLLHIPEHCKAIGLFPGSRSREIKRLLPIMLEAAALLLTIYPGVQFFLARAKSVTTEELMKHLRTSKIPIQIVTEANYDLMQACDAIIAASGTVTLEIALVATPLVIIYKLAWWEYQLAKRLIKIPYIGLCNILAKKMIAPELLQNNATPEKIAYAIYKILTDDIYCKKMVEELQQVRATLTREEPADLAKLIVELSGVVK